MMPLNATDLRYLAGLKIGSTTLAANGCTGVRYVRAALNPLTDITQPNPWTV